MSFNHGLPVGVTRGRRMAQHGENRSPADPFAAPCESTQTSQKSGHATLGNWTIEIVKRSDVAKGLVLLPRRWVVERTLALLNRNRRLAKDVEATIESAVTWLYIASVKLMRRRLVAA
jgi:hypothetical protein